LLRELLERLVRGDISIEEAEKELKLLAVEEVGSLATLDVGREARHGVPEVIIAEGKTPEDVVEIAGIAVARGARAIISRAAPDHLQAIKSSMGGQHKVEVTESGRTVVVRREGSKPRRTGGRVGVITAGTSDIPVGDEAAVMAREMGCDVTTTYDVGAAGVHRLFRPLKQMIEEDVDVVVVVAGREGALATLVSGMVDVPVIAVPTSSGYGFGGGGVTALMSMLQSCSLGLAVVNIDGGIPAGAVAALIANRTARYRAARETAP
jgi:NCAIR mutase (PurE)-related protein